MDELTQLSADTSMHTRTHARAHTCTTTIPGLEELRHAQRLGNHVAHHPVHTLPAASTLCSIEGVEGKRVALHELDLRVPHEIGV